MQDISRLQFDVIGTNFAKASGPATTESVNKVTPRTPTEGDVTGTLKDWFTVILLVVFVVLYALAFAGKLDPFKDNAMLLRFEPVIFILIGYYFGRSPSRQSERSLRDEIARQALRVDAALQIKEKAQLEKEVLEERIRNARTYLESERFASGSQAGNTGSPAVESAIRILSL